MFQILSNYLPSALWERKIQLATPSFLKMFDRVLIKGDTSALTKPYTAAITESTAKKYFGENDPIGK